MGRTALRLSGFRFDGDFPDEPKMMIIVVPHTSAWDVFVALAVVWALGLGAHWIGKHTIFRWPFAGLMRWLGGIPVRRDAAQGLVDQVVAEFDRHEAFVLGLAPEGTRRKVDRWRSGFWHIARQSGAPIVAASIDYDGRRVVIAPPFRPGAEFAQDLAELRRWFDEHGGARLRP
jgi:1-acyl-sn-glycerol-3-phosphate acyltransferase